MDEVGREAILWAAERLLCETAEKEKIRKTGLLLDRIRVPSTLSDKTIELRYKVHGGYLSTGYKTALRSWLQEAKRSIEQGEGLENGHRSKIDLKDN